MGCATCGGRGHTTLAARQSTRYRSSRIADTEETVLIEFTGTGSRTLSPPGSGRTYRFGSDASHRQRRVRKDDAKRILSNSQFKIVQEEKPVAAVAAEGETHTPARGRPRKVEVETSEEAPAEE